MKKFFKVLAVLIGLTFSAQSLAEFAKPSWVKPQHKPVVGGTSFAAAQDEKGKDSKTSNSSDAKHKNIVGLNFVVGNGSIVVGNGSISMLEQSVEGLAVGGEFFYAYESSKAFDVNYKLRLDTVVGRGLFEFNLDNIVYANVIPDFDYLKLDLGLNTRIYLDNVFLNFLLYAKVTGIVPDLGLNVYLETNIGTLDVWNSDVKLAVAYELPVGNSNLGFELGYKHGGSSNWLGAFSSENYKSYDAFTFGVYYKF